MKATDEKAQRIKGVGKPASPVQDSLGMNGSGTDSKSDAGLTQAGSLDVPTRKFADFSVDSSTWGHTYFVRRGDAIKIGHSALPRQRISSLQTGFPDALEVLAIIPNTIIGEGDAHKKFNHLRLQGEWFRAAPELLQFIEKVKQEAEKMPKKQYPTAPELSDLETLQKMGSLLSGRFSKLPDHAKPIASNIIQQIKNFPKNPDGLRPFIAKQVAEFERRMCVTEQV